MSVDRNEAIETLEKKLEHIFSYVKNDENFHSSVVRDYKKYKEHYKDLLDCYNKTLESYDHIIHRYSGDLASGYEHFDLESLILEHRLWSFAQNNPEQWYMLIEKIAFTDQSANIFTPDGFSFMDNFIHNGMYDDWCLGLASKQEVSEHVFFDVENDSLKKQYIDTGYNVVNVNEKSIKSLLDILENVPEIEETLKTVEKKHKVKK